MRIKKIQYDTMFTSISLNSDGKTVDIRPLTDKLLF